MGIENPRGGKDPGGEERKPIIKDGTITFPDIKGVAWSHMAQEALGPDWKPHVLPIGKTDPKSEWEQTAPIPVFRNKHTRETPKGPYTVEHLKWGATGVENVIGEGSGQTLKEAEDSIRDVLAYHVKQGKEVDMQPSPEMPSGATGETEDIVRQLGEELFPYFRNKLEDSKN